MVFYGFNSSIFFSKLLELLFFLQSIKKVDQGTFPQSRKFSTNKKVLYEKSILDQGNFLQTRKFSTNNFFFLDRGNVPQTKIFTQ